MATEAEPREDKGPRSIARFLEQLGDGEMHADASLALHELCSALQDESLRLNQKVKGALELTFKLTCDPRGVLTIDFEPKKKMQTKKRAPAQAWIDKFGRPVFEPPRQTKLPLHEVGGKAGAAELSDRRSREV